MVSLADLTARFTKDHAQPEYREALIAALPTSTFGKAVASQITELSVEGTTLVLKVPDAAWRLELAKHKIRLMIKVREILPEVRNLSIID